MRTLWALGIGIALGLTAAVIVAAREPAAPLPDSIGDLPGDPPGAAGVEDAPVGGA